VQDVAGWKQQAAFAGRRRLRILVEAAHVTRRIIGPALAADIGVEMRVAVGDDVETGHFLLVQIEANRVDILLAELVVDHGVEEAAHAEVLRVPARPRQRAGDGGRQHFVFGGAKHGGRFSRGYLRREAIVGIVRPVRAQRELITSIR